MVLVHLATIKKISKVWLGLGLIAVKIAPIVAVSIRTAQPIIQYHATLLTTQYARAACLVHQMQMAFCRCESAAVELTLGSAL